MMETATAALALSALGHESRLEVFRLLVRAGPAGLAAGEIARRTGIRSNTLSSHLQLLKAAGLIAGRRNGRSIVYSAEAAQFGALLTYLVEDCCGGQSETCTLPFKIVNVA